MKSVRIPMTATRILRLAKYAEKTKGKSVAFLLAEGLKNLETKPASHSRKV